MKKDVKSNLLSHSQAKVKLLGDYLYKYISIISNDRYTEKINLYDLFCGPGLYDDGGEGSPLVILRKINNSFQASYTKTPKIDCYFNDYSEDKITALRSTVKNNKKYQNKYGSTKYASVDYLNMIENLPQHIPTQKNQKSFVFIDPYGYKEVRASHIKSILSSKNSEVLLWLPTQHMYRFSDNGTPESLHKFTEELTDYRKWKESDSVWKFINQLKNGFRNFLGSEIFVDTFTIQKEPQTVFCLFFFTSHIKGYEKMLETKWNIDTEFGQGWEYSGNTPTLFAEHKTNALAEKLVSYLKDYRSNGDLYNFTLEHSYLPKHTYEILMDWQECSMITIEEYEGTRANKNAFYLNYDNYQKNFNRIKIKMK